MIFRNFPRRALSSKLKVKLVLYFLGEGGPINERGLERRLDVSHVAVGKALKDLKDTNLLKCEKIGNANIYVVNKESYAFKVLNNLSILATKPPLVHLKQELASDFGSRYIPHIKRAVLFGSIAQGKEVENSDMDVFFLVGKEADKKAVTKRVVEVGEKYRKLYGNEISPYVKTEKEMKRASKDMIKNIEQGLVII